MKRRRIGLAIAAAAVLLAPILSGLGRTLLAPTERLKAEDVVQLSLEPAQVTLARGGTVELTVIATIHEGYHVNSNQPTLDYLIPSKLEVPADAPLTLVKADYPAGKLESFGFAPDQPLSVYEGTVKIPVRLRARKSAATGAGTLKLAFRYQACNDRLCLRPTSREAVLHVVIR